MDKDIYNPPDASLITDEMAQQPLATRLSRLGASLIDGLIMMSVTVPLMFVTGGFDGMMEGRQPGLAYSLVMFLVSVVIFVAINYRLLVSRGQTVGKKMLGIKITDLQGQVPSGAALIKRYLVYFLVPQVPFVGAALSFINLAFIFGESRRCVHDLAAETRVVRTL